MPLAEMATPAERGRSYGCVYAPRILVEDPGIVDPRAQRVPVILRRCQNIADKLTTKDGSLVGGKAIDMKDNELPLPVAGTKLNAAAAAPS
jgi:hypothetical protein